MGEKRKQIHLGVIQRCYLHFSHFQSRLQVISQNKYFTLQELHLGLNIVCSGKMAVSTKRTIKEHLSLLVERPKQTKLN